jgi:class 3 adenylate cyclase
MEEQIRYCTSADGTQIAYADSQGGALPATVAVAHSLLPIGSSDGDSALLPIIAGRRNVGFDRRGVGYSQRDVSRIDLDAQIEDLSAVIASTETGRFNLVGLGDGCAVAATYAARSPEQVIRLALVMPWWESSAVMEGLTALIRSNWNLGRRALIDASMGDLPSERRAQLIARTRRIVAPEVAATYVELASTWRPGPELASIQSPTLMCVRRAGEERMSRARAFVSAIPNARLKVIEDSMAPDVRVFLDGEDVSSPGRTAALSAGTQSVVTILFTDLASSTALTQRLGDAKAQELVRAHNAIVREALAAHGGSEIKHTGDGIMASFPTASGALECAVAIQRGVGARGDADLQVHIGLNAGEPVAEESDLFGTSVQLARRICDHASAGQVLVSNVVRELAAGKGFLFSDIGEVVPKGFEEPVRLYEVRWRE